ACGAVTGEDEGVGQGGVNGGKVLEDFGVAGIDVEFAGIEAGGELVFERALVQKEAEFGAGEGAGGGVDPLVGGRIGEGRQIAGDEVGHVCLARGAVGGDDGGLLKVDSESADDVVRLGAGEIQPRVAGGGQPAVNAVNGEKSRPAGVENVVGVVRRPGE